MSKKITIGVIFGGRSQEHEVSLVSAASIMKALDKKKYNVVPIGITKEGKWIASGDALELLKSGKIPKQLKAILPPDPTEKRLISMQEKNKKLVPIKKTLASVRPYQKIDVIFPILHGPYGEDGTVQGLLELANIPYVGADVLASSIGMDKVIQKQLFKQAGLPVIKYLWFKQTKLGKVRGGIIFNVEKKIGYPCFVKPASLGSSVGISKAKKRRELDLAIHTAFKYDDKILIEEAIEGREIECAVLGNEYPEASLPGEIIPSQEFYDYKAKYIDGASKTLAPAPNLTKKQIKKIQDLAIRAFKAIDCSGMARVDFLLQKKPPKTYVNEINTIPGFTSISMYPKLWEVSGIPYPELLDRLIQLALEKHKTKTQLKTTYTPKEKWYK